MSRLHTLLAIPALLALACRTAPTPVPERRAAVPRNVVLLVGDGMGSSHFAAAKLLRGDAFAAGRFPVTGVVSTRSASSVVTDSAAAATAMATGTKANNKSLGVDPQGHPVTTLVELAARQGRATGLVTTSFFCDATPAAFAVHTARREQVTDIVHQLLESEVDLIAGGGAELFGTEGLPSLSTAAAEHGWSLVTEPSALASAPAKKALAVFPSQKNAADMPGARLPDLARWALERLSTDPDGFFLLLEHEGTDSASHENSAEDLKNSLRSFDETVGIVADFARQRGDTLVLVVGDHETGGLRVLADGAGGVALEFGSNAHTGSLVPLFALGPGSERFSGLYENTEIAHKVQALYGAGQSEVTSHATRVSTGGASGGF
ncbi:alkaline phosphatase [Pyxidicoccus parkwayensis]|uniref:Alkaline phosphatase n=1 Tax=Pyxidicoccus parkwayensis TaxID=2813578 RepID=A0ABX7P0M4_9BACT|nr:alkaline phosphatase [Pyxidicoccus parkwaysis]QSQ24543.1 alkaline phosphatase [Pyxidicoccus parkwaysis]